MDMKNSILMKKLKDFANSIMFINFILRGEKRVKKGEDDNMGNEWNLFPRIYGSCFSFLLEN